ncbi:MAG TPA: CAP domain-containing protein [Actinomycetota bacterium]|nr:CAP domain-containing protein [Actinomycetota bacterium]
MRRTHIVLVVVAGLLLPLFTASPAAPACSGTANTAEKGFFSKMNAERKKKGKVPLKLDTQLSKPAKLHTKEMINKGTLEHTPDDVLAKRVTNWKIIGENVGVGGDVKSLHDAFMNSPSHRDNILFSDYRYVGVGARKADGKLWVTVIFESVNDPGTTVTNC